MPSPKVDPKVAPTERVLLHEMALHPLPAFLWLGLYENATSDEVGRAYRQLSRTHHPDRGGSVLKWQITKKSLELLKGDERRSAYVRSRNHVEFLVQEEQGSAALTSKQRIERMQRARAAAHERKAKVKVKVDDVMRQKVVAETRAVEDLDTRIEGPFPAPWATQLGGEHARGPWSARVEWKKRLSDRLLREGCSYVLQHQCAVGARTPTPWRVVYKGEDTRHVATGLTDDDPEYIAVHSFRVQARYGCGTSTDWSEAIAEQPVEKGPRDSCSAAPGTPKAQEQEFALLSFPPGACARDWRGPRRRNATQVRTLFRFVPGRAGRSSEGEASRRPLSRWRAPHCGNAAWTTDAAAPQQHADGGPRANPRRPLGRRAVGAERAEGAGAHAAARRCQARVARAVGDGAARG